MNQQDDNDYWIYGLANEDVENFAKEYFPYKTVSPEEYASKNFIMRGFPHFLYHYQDQKLDIWMKRVIKLLYDLVPEDWEEDFKKEYPYKTMSPELYAAWFGHEIMLFDLHFWHYRDKQLEKWIRRFGELLVKEGLIEYYQKTLLTSEELEIVNKMRRSEDALDLTPKETEILDQVFKLAGRKAE